MIKKLDNKNEARKHFFDAIGIDLSCYFGWFCCFIIWVWDEDIDKEVVLIVTWAMLFVFGQSYLKILYKQYVRFFIFELNWSEYQETYIRGKKLKVRTKKH